MAFRSIVIHKAIKISLDLDNLLIQYGEDPFWINLEEIHTIVIDDPRCLVSLRLLSELCERGIEVIFTDASHMPVGSLLSLMNHSRASKKYMTQIKWSSDIKDYLWTEVVRRKIKNQIQTLDILEKRNKIELLQRYELEIENADRTNREGLASRTYFKELFGNQFKRFEEDVINFCLNYSYQVIRSKIAQQIVACGYYPALGIHHCSEYNSFNLADDLIEVFRPIVDYFVYQLLSESKEDYLTPALKNQLVNILNEKIMYRNQNQKIQQVVNSFLTDIFSFLETGDIERIHFPELIWIL